jgi:hypothetical protein
VAQTTREMFDALDEWIGRAEEMPALSPLAA